MNFSHLFDDGEVQLGLTEQVTYLFWLAVLKSNKWWLYSIVLQHWDEKSLSRLISHQQFNFCSKKVLNLLKCDSIKILILCYNTCLKQNGICFFYRLKSPEENFSLRPHRYLHYCQYVCMSLVLFLCQNCWDSCSNFYEWRLLLFAVVSKGSVFYFIVLKFQIPVRASPFRLNGERCFLVLAYFF